MKSTVCKLLLVLLSLPLPSVAQSPATSDTEIRIKRVEQGLLPAVVIKGDKSWSIEERMKHYKVPGLSMAVIKD